MSVITETQEEKIIALRQRGITYQEIGNITSLPLDTVKSFCRRNNITVPGKAKSEPRPAKPKPKKPGLPGIAFCLNCNRLITQAPKQKPKKFCCPKCRDIWWNKNRNLVSSSRRVAYCAYCGGEFEKFDSSKQRYCRKQCYILDRFGEVPQK